MDLLFLWHRLFSLKPSLLSWLSGSWLTLTAISVMLVMHFNSGRGAARHRLPPGPRPWPILGNLPLLGPLVHQDFQRFAKQYGPIFRLCLGSKDTVVITSPRLAEEVLKTHDKAFASRPTHLLQFKILMYNGQTIASSPFGPFWRFSKKVLTSQLLTDKRIQHFKSVRKEEIVHGLLTAVEECKSGQAIHLRHHLSHISLNTITRMAMNKTFGGPSTSCGTSLSNQAGDVGQTVEDLLSMLACFNLGDYVPLLRPFDLQGHKKRMRVVARKMDTFLQEIIDDRREQWKRCSHEQQLADLKDEGMDFIHTLLTQPKMGVDEKPLTDMELKAIINDMIIGGSESSTLTIEWTMTELLRNPALLKRAQDELDIVVGRDRLVEESDLPNLTYLRCIVKEALRLHPVGPNMFPHESIEPREIGGYYIPAKTQLFVSVYAMHRDPDVWECPLEFYPDRFLSSDIDVHGQDFQLLPFGSGRQSCPGKNLALLMMHYMLALLLHACDWAPPAGVRPQDVDVDEGGGIVMPEEKSPGTCCISKIAHGCHLWRWPKNLLEFVDVAR